MASKTNTPVKQQETLPVRRMTFEEAAATMVAEQTTMEDIVLDIVNATDIAGILGGSAVSLESVLGKPFTIERGELRESDFTDGLAAYVVMHGHFDDGEPVIVISGAQKVVAQVVAMHAKGFLPYRVVGSKSNKPTKDGYWPMSLGEPTEKYNPEDHKAF